MLSRLIVLGLAGAMPVAVSAASGKGHTTRYWDCCKSSCAWSGKASVSEPVLTCDKQENPIVDANAPSGCDGGGAFACTSNSPWAVNDDLAITFTSGPIAGKKMVVQSTNTGGDLVNNRFDLMIPGGGLGIFDGCSSQFGQLLPGERYGGVSSRSQCDLMPELLKDGCQWRFDWFQNADNPDIEFQQVQCPKELTAISGCVRDDDSSFPVFNGGSGSDKPSTTKTHSQVTTTSKTPPQTNPPSETKAAMETGSPQQPASDKTTATQTPAMIPTTTAVSPVSKPTSAARVALWGQCDSEASWEKPLKCEKGTKCVFVNKWYSQCRPKNSCA